MWAVRNKIPIKFLLEFIIIYNKKFINVHDIIIYFYLLKNKKV